MKALNKGAHRRMDTDADYRRGVMMLVTLVRKKRFRKDVREDELRHSVPECGKKLPDYQLKKRQCVSYYCKNCNIKFETNYSINHSDYPL